MSRIGDEKEAATPPSSGLPRGDSLGDLLQRWAERLSRGDPSPAAGAELQEFSGGCFKPQHFSVRAELEKQCVDLPEELPPPKVHSVKPPVMKEERSDAPKPPVVARARDSPPPKGIHAPPLKEKDTSGEGDSSLHKDDEEPFPDEPLSPLDTILFSMHVGQLQFDSAVRLFAADMTSKTDEFLIKNMILRTICAGEHNPDNARLRKALDLPLMECLAKISDQGLLEDRHSKRPIKALISMFVVLLDKLKLNCLSKLVPDFKGNDRVTIGQLKFVLRDPEILRQFKREMNNPGDLERHLNRNFQIYFRKNIEKWKARILSKCQWPPDLPPRWRADGKIQIRMILSPKDIFPAYEYMNWLLKQVELDMRKS